MKSDLNKINSYLILCGFGHVIWLVVFIFWMFLGPFHSEEGIVTQSLEAMSCEVCEQAVDSIHAASQMGRLDFVALSLTVLGTVIAISAFGGFFVIRHSAMAAAAEQAEEYVEKNLHKLVSNSDVLKAISENDRLLLTLANIVKNQISDTEKGMSKSQADDIADSMKSEEFNGE